MYTNTVPRNHQLHQPGHSGRNHFAPSQEKHLVPVPGHSQEQSSIHINLQKIRPVASIQRNHKYVIKIAKRDQNRTQKRAPNSH